MAPDLFSFLDTAPPGDESDNEVLADKLPIPASVPVSTSSQKRKLSPGNVDLGGLPPAPREAVERPVKRSRAASPAPVVVDEFQTEAKREMAASGGLTGPVEEGSRLELRHQVCDVTSLYRLFLCCSGPASSRHSSRLRLCSHCKTYSSLKTCSGIQIHP
jgi:ATP-dependent RNA helicase DOB1